jgi:hypothetical protein
MFITKQNNSLKFYGSGSQGYPRTLVGGSPAPEAQPRQAFLPNIQPPFNPEQIYIIPVSDVYQGNIFSGPKVPPPAMLGADNKNWQENIDVAATKNGLDIYDLQVIPAPQSSLQLSANGLRQVDKNSFVVRTLDDTALVKIYARDNNPDGYPDQTLLSINGIPQGNDELSLFLPLGRHEITYTITDGAPHSNKISSVTAIVYVEPRESALPITLSVERGIISSYYSHDDYTDRPQINATLGLPADQDFAVLSSDVGKFEQNSEQTIRLPRGTHSLRLICSQDDEDSWLEMQVTVQDMPSINLQIFDQAVISENAAAGDFLLTTANNATTLYLNAENFLPPTAERSLDFSDYQWQIRHDGALLNYLGEDISLPVMPSAAPYEITLTTPITSLVLDVFVQQVPIAKPDVLPGKRGKPFRYENGNIFTELVLTENYKKAMLGDGGISPGAEIIAVEVGVNIYDSKFLAPPVQNPYVSVQDNYSKIGLDHVKKIKEYLSNSGYKLTGGDQDKVYLCIPETPDVLAKHYAKYRDLEDEVRAMATMAEARKSGDAEPVLFPTSEATDGSVPNGGANRPAIVYYYPDAQSRNTWNFGRNSQGGEIQIENPQAGQEVEIDRKTYVLQRTEEGGWRLVEKIRIYLPEGNSAAEKFSDQEFPQQSTLASPAQPPQAENSAEVTAPPLPPNANASRYNFKFMYFDGQAAKVKEKIAAGDAAEAINLYNDLAATYYDAQLHHKNKNLDQSVYDQIEEMDDALAELKKEINKLQF